MAISFVGSMVPVGANNGGNVTLTFTGASGLINAAGAQAALQQGDVVVCVYAASGTADLAMSTSSTGWTELAEAYANGTVDTNLAVYYKVMGATPDTGFVAVGPTGNNNATIATAFAFRGVDSSVLDIAFSGHSATGTTSTRPNAPAITPVTAGAWIFVAGAGSTAAVAGAAFTNPGDLSAATNHFRSGNHAETNDCAIGAGIKTDWASGAFDAAAWTGGAANADASWAAMVLALKPQAAVSHATTGALAGPGSTVAGTSAHRARHTTTGSLAGQGSTVAGASVHRTNHATSGTLTGAIGSLAGSATRTRQHVTAGVLAGPGAALAGSSARMRSHATSGALSGVPGPVSGAASRSGPVAAVTHTTTGSLIGSEAILAALAAVQSIRAGRRRRKKRRDYRDRWRVGP
jgi:hypothetical protein